MEVDQTPDVSAEQRLLALYRTSLDTAVLGQLYRPYMPMVYGVCLKYLKDREESRDAVMQIFEKLVVTLRTHEVTHFKSWLYVTSRNYCLMQLRSSRGRSFQQIDSEFMEMEFILHPDGGDELELNIARLHKCIGELGIEQRKCVELFFLQQKCYRDIGQLTGFEDSKVKSYIQNGKRNLKICMERNG